MTFTHGIFGCNGVRDIGLCFPFIGKRRLIPASVIALLVNQNPVSVFCKRHRSHPLIFKIKAICITLIGLLSSPGWASTLVPECNDPTIAAIQKTYGEVPQFIRVALKRYPLAFLDKEEETQNGFKVDGRFYHTVGIALNNGFFKGWKVDVEDPYAMGVLAHEAWHAYEYILTQDYGSCEYSETSATYVGSLFRFAAPLAHGRASENETANFIRAEMDIRGARTVCDGKGIQLPRLDSMERKTIQKMIGGHYLDRIKNSIH